MKVLDWLYLFVVGLFKRFGSPVETHGKDSEDVLELKKHYEEAAEKQK